MMRRNQQEALRSSSPLSEEAEAVVDMAAEAKTQDDEAQPTGGAEERQQQPPAEEAPAVVDKAAEAKTQDDEAQPTGGAEGPGGG